MHTSLMSRTGPEVVEQGAAGSACWSTDRAPAVRLCLGACHSPGPIPSTVLLPAAICVLPASWMSRAQRLSDCAVAWRSSRSSSDAIWSAILA